MPLERILIVGLGSIGSRHLRLARQLLPDADIRILRHRPQRPIPDLANGVFFRINDAVNFAPQLSVIANPAPFHLSVSIELAKAGSHLLVEKPLSHSLDGVPQLLKTCRENGVSLHTGYNLRYDSALLFFSRLVRQELVGAVLSVRCEVGQFLPDWRVDADYRESVSARKALGGGVLLELSHELDYLRWIFGDVEWVCAQLSHQSSLEVDVEDTAHISLRFKKTSTLRPLLAVAHLDFIRQDPTRYCLAIGEKGTLRWNGLTGSVDLYPVGGKKWETLFNRKESIDESYISQWRHLINCAENQLSQIHSGEDGLKVLEIVEAARESAVSGRTVSLGSIQRRERWTK
jgi:predicted dehydrogenase